VPLDHYLQVVDSVYQQFLKRSIDSQEELWEAYSVGTRLQAFLEKMKTHADYSPKRVPMEKTLGVYLGKMEWMIDQQAYQDYICEILQDQVKSMESESKYEEPSLPEERAYRLSAHVEEPRVSRNTSYGTRESDSLPSMQSGRSMSSRAPTPLMKNQHPLLYAPKQTAPPQPTIVSPEQVVRKESPGVSPIKRQRKHPVESKRVVSPETKYSKAVVDSSDFEDFSVSTSAFGHAAFLDAPPANHLDLLEEMSEHDETEEVNFATSFETPLEQNPRIFDRFEKPAQFELPLEVDENSRVTEIVKPQRMKAFRSCVRSLLH